MDKTLTDIANRLELDKGTIMPTEGHHGPRLHFTTIYEKYMEKPKSILEIGVLDGKSLKMWKEYFPDAKVYGIDLHPKCTSSEIYTADQSSREQLKDVMEKIGGVDIIVDDGSHVIEHQQISLGFLYKYLNKGGQYWIEDLHTSDNQWQDKTLYGYAMDFKEYDSTVNFMKRCIKSDYDSTFITKDELEYLKYNTSDVKLFNLPETFYGENNLGLFIKNV